jgi:hypothetical protein
MIMTPNEIPTIETILILVDTSGILKSLAVTDGNPAALYSPALMPSYNMHT